MIKQKSRLSEILKAKSSLSDVEALAAKLEPKMAAAVTAALQAQKDSIDLDAIAAALKAGRIDAVLAALGLDKVEAFFAGVKQAANEAAWAGGLLGAASVNLQLRGVVFTFDQLNPRLIDWLRSYSLGLIKQVNESTREAVRDYLVQGMTAGEGPLDVARQVKGVIGLTSKQAKAVSNFRKQLETFHEKRSAKSWKLGGSTDKVHGLQVFKPDESGEPKDGVNARRLRDFRYDKTLIKAMQTGKPLSKEQVDKMVARYEDRYLKHRAQTIARTEALRTTNIGVQDAWRQAIESGKMTEDLVRRQWIIGRDERTCQICRPIPSMNPKIGVKFGQPFATPTGPTMLPPKHPSCRCTVFLRQWEPEQIAMAENG